MNGSTFDGIYKSEITNATCSGLYDPFELCWSSPILSIVGIPAACLPKVIDTTSSDFGYFENFNIRIGSICGDANAGMFGEKMTNIGDVKITLGTGAFVDINTGCEPFASATGAYPVVGWKLNEKITYLAEADDQSCGMTLDWAVQAGFFETIEQGEMDANKVDSSDGVLFIPGIWGISTPVNDSTTSGSIIGMNSKTKSSHISRSIFEAIAFRSYQLIRTLEEETQKSVR